MIYFDQKLRAGLDPAHNLSSCNETVKKKEKKKSWGGGTRKHKNQRSINSKKPPNAKPPLMLSPTGEAGDGL